MSALSYLRAAISFIDNVDGKGADVFARALLADPMTADRLPSFITFEMLRDVLEEEGPALRAIAAGQPTEMADNFLKSLGIPMQGANP